MGNCISRISKDRLLSLEEFKKNKSSFEKGKSRPDLDILTAGTYTRIHKKKRWPCYKLTRGGETFKNNSALLEDILCYPKWVKHCVPLLG